MAEWLNAAVLKSPAGASMRHRKRGLRLGVMTIVTCEGQPVRNPLPNRYQIGILVTASNVQALSC